jgi:3-phosphoshikimate 1-carboxyvinyltransferase
VKTTVESQRVSAEPIRIHVPGDKSITHRALLFSTLARGRSSIRNALVSLDTGSTASCLRQLGVRVPELDDHEVVIEANGVGTYHPPRVDLDCGNSGTTARLLLGTLSGCAFRSVLTGDASLRSRPMRRVTRPLSEAGATFEELGEPDRLPIAVQGGALQPIHHSSAQASAQVKSALLLAGITANVSARVSEPYRSRDHTERMLAAMGAPIHARQDDCRYTVALEPFGDLQPLDITVPGDFSSATFFLAYGLLSGIPVLVERTGINPSRTGFLDVARRMGAQIDVTAERAEGGEPVADLATRASALRATGMHGADVVHAIDEVPILAILASRAEGETRITGASELRVKESDRIVALAENLRAVGVVAEELSDGLTIRGTDAPLRGHVRTQHDHRIAMAFGVLAALPGNEIEIDHPDVAAVSFPRFWEQLRACAARGR